MRVLRIDFLLWRINSSRQGYAECYYALEIRKLSHHVVSETSPCRSWQCSLKPLIVMCSVRCQTTFVLLPMKRLFVTSIIALTLLKSADAAAILAWNTFGNAGTETTEPSFSNDAGVSAANLTLGAGVTAAANGNRFGGNAWFDTGDTNPTTLAESVAGNDYIQFIVTPVDGFSVSVTSFVFSWDHSSTGPGSLTLRSSADGFTSDLGGVTGLAASITTGNTINITTVPDFTTSTTFRLYGFGATASTGTGGFDTASSVVNVQLNGTVDPVPEPTSIPLVVGGVGTLLLFRRRSRG